MKIKINIKYKKQIKKFKSNYYLKKELINLFSLLKKNYKITFFNSLKKISGINNSTAYFLLAQTGISSKNSFKRVSKYFSLLNNRLHKLIIKNNIIFFKEIFLKKNKNIQKKIKLNNYSGNRHKFFLPIRGQRTSTNASTRKKFKIK